MTQPSNSAKPKQQIRVQNISCIIPHSQKLGGLYLGNFYGAQNQEILQQYGIRAVLSLSPQVPFKYNPLKIPFFKKIKAHDKDDYQILADFEQCIKFIQKHRKITNVYVHCYAGVSRSATVVIAYLMKIYNMNLQSSLAFVKKKRIVAKPNEGFLKQLKTFQKQLECQNLENKQQIRYNPKQLTNQKKSALNKIDNIKKLI